MLTLFYRYGRGHQIAKTLDWVEQVLIHNACASGTLYYVNQEQFYFFLSRLIQSSPIVRKRLEKNLRRRVTERFGADGDALSLAMRIYAAATLGLVDQIDFDKLLTMQQQDGSWRNSVYYKFPSVKQTAGNDGITTAIAIQAIEAVKSLQAEVKELRGSQRLGRFASIAGLVVISFSLVFLRAGHLVPGILI